MPLDSKRLQIGWVGVEKDGVLTEYVDPSAASSITPERIEAEKRLMDCVDCHNRASHVFRSPDDLINQAMEEGRIDGGIPFIKREALNAIGSPSPSEMEEIAVLTTFPEMRVDWNTHADHSGHNKPPEELLAGLNISFENWRTNQLFPLPLEAGTGQRHLQARGGGAGQAARRRL